jgi:hypothetical protein
MGGVHSLARRVAGVTTKGIRVRMADIDPTTLPSVTEARERQAARAGERSAVVLKFTPRRPPRENRPQRQAA